MLPPAIDTDAIDGLADADDAEAAAIAVAIAAHPPGARSRGSRGRSR